MLKKIYVAALLAAASVHAVQLEASLEATGGVEFTIEDAFEHCDTNDDKRVTMAEVIKCKQDEVADQVAMSIKAKWPKDRDALTFDEFKTAFGL